MLATSSAASGRLRSTIGNTYITGSVYISTWRVLTVRLDATGNQLWARIYGPDDGQATAQAVDGAGNVYLTGRTYSGYYPAHDFLTLKYDADGNLEWAVKHNGTYDHTDNAHAVAVDPGGNVVVTVRPGRRPGTATS